MSGIAGRIAGAFLHSRLTPLMTGAALLAGALGLAATPREEEPQIAVPMIDVLAQLPGATPQEVEQRLTQPIEREMWALPGVEHVYGHADYGRTLVTVRFRVGEDQERSVTRVRARLASLPQLVPASAAPLLVQPHAIDDVPILALTIHGGGRSSEALRPMALQLAEQLATVPDVAQVQVTGGRSPQLRVALDPVRLTARGVSAVEVVTALQAANLTVDAGTLGSGGKESILRVTGRLRSAEDVGAVRVGRAGARVRDVADVALTTGEPLDYVTHAVPGRLPVPAVTIALAKRPGANATVVAEAVLARVTDARARLLPAELTVTVTRNYGETAREKSAELMRHLALATLSVTLLVGLVLGWREAVVVLVAVPVTLALTLFAYYAFGYTLNRITLFALIFSIGILVDDAIVVVENMHRHMQRGGDPSAAALAGVDEVGNPTILATATVIAAILPMAFVSGLMGPYMRPIPVGASVAMLASLAVAFIVTPWLALRLLKGHATSPAHAAPGRVMRGYVTLMARLLDRPAWRRTLYVGTLVLLAGSLALLVTRAVQVKMLPFDNKSEFQVILDLPEGTPLETTAAAADALAARLRQEPDVIGTQVYAGTAAPANFNGLVRHYFLRRGPTVADVQVTLAPAHDRTRQSHAIAVAVRPALDSIGRQYGANVKVAEIPPGPPVLSTLVAEVYAADEATRVRAAERVQAVFRATPGVVDVDWTREAPQPIVQLQVDAEQAALAGTSVEAVARTVGLTTGGVTATEAEAPVAREAMPVVVRLPTPSRATLGGLLAVPVPAATGLVPLARVVRADTGVRAPSRVRKDNRPVIYVMADVAGAIESPVYAILAMERALDTVRVDGATITRYHGRAPARLDETALRWDGEWQVTLEVFRDLGLAFAVVLVLIYVLVVGWFRSYSIPLVIMAPIPLTLAGILPGHVLGGAFFTATSMIGMIALAGIIVRNSILLVDFVQLAEAEGRTLREAVIEAGAVRARPIALTAAAVVLGGAVMVLDPIFQGLAVSLMSGAVVATALTMVLVPLLYWELQRRAPTTSTGASHVP